MGETTGQSVGYQIRYENVAGPRTRLKFITEGVFLRLLLSDPTLSQVDCVVLDEFHERHIQTDVALALARHLQTTARPDLQLVIMSATLNAEALRVYLPEARVFRSEVRMFPVDVDYLKQPDRRTLEDATTAAVRQCLLQKKVAGHVLVFLPGAAEIRRTAERLADIAQQGDCVVLELRSETPPEQQRQVFEPTAQRKIILATNVAETSITIDGVTAVVDCGLARIPGHDAWSGLPSLETRPVSQASCTQRAGRAGRTAPGVALRLYTEHDYLTRRAAEKPEIQRLDLSQVLLELLFLKSRFPKTAQFDIQSLPWFDAPPEKMLQGCSELLRMLGAVENSNALTETGRRMVEFPLHPRLSRAILEGEALGVAPQIALGAALLNEGMILKRGAESSVIAQSDVAHQMDLLRPFLQGRRPHESMDTNRARSVQRLAASLCQSIRCSQEAMLMPVSEESLGLALLAGFPDRVAQVRRATAKRSDKIELLLCTGGTAMLSRSSAVRQSEFLLALEAEELRGHQEAASSAQIRAASGIEKEMLLNGPEMFLREEEVFLWDTSAQRARGTKRLRYGTLVLEEKQIQAQDSRFAQTLRQALLEQWPRPFEDAEAPVSLRRRASLLNENGFEVNVPEFRGAAFEKLLDHIAQGKKSFAEVLERNLQEYLQDLISPADLRLLREHAPETIVVGAGRKVSVHYEEGKPPWIESALQDFFGTRVTPRIAAGRVPLVVHLLAPNRRPVQVTQDLESFWKRHYPELRKTLSRRYPKHSWPDDPMRADPPRKR